MNKTFIYPWPPSINSLYFQGKSHGQKFLSKKGKEYKQKLVELYANDDMEPITEPVMITIDLFPPDRRTRDIDNYIKPLLDGLKFLEVLQDDSLIAELRVIKHEKQLDYNKGGALISIIKFDNNVSNLGDKIRNFLSKTGLNTDEYMLNFHVETKRSDERYKRSLKKKDGEV